jgi:hypothetical protein
MTNIMALQTSGPISLDDIRQELSISGEISLNNSEVRQLADKSSGAISLSDFYGKRAAAKNLKIFYASGSFIVPDDVTEILAIVVGGGGGAGGSTSSSTQPGNGGSGARAYGTVNVTPRQEITVTVGSGRHGDNRNGRGGWAGTSTFDYVSSQGGWGVCGYRKGNYTANGANGSVLGGTKLSVIGEDNLGLKIADDILSVVQTELSKSQLHKGSNSNAWIPASQENSYKYGGGGTGNGRYFKSGTYYGSGGIGGAIFLIY